MRFLGPCRLLPEIISAGSEYQTISMNFITVFYRLLDVHFIFAFNIPEISILWLIES